MTVTKFINIQDQKAFLLEGFSTDKELSTGYLCLNLTQGNILPIGSYAAQILMSESTSYDEVKSLITKSLDTDLIEESIYSSSIAFIANIDLPGQAWYPDGLGLQLLSPFGKGVYSSGEVNFRKVCGDLFLSEQQFGISLIANYKINFATEEDKQQFDKSISVGVAGILDISKNIEKVANHYQFNGEVEFSATQIGGNDAKLSLIFNNTDLGNMLKCDIKNMYDCMDLTTSVFNYVQTELLQQSKIALYSPSSYTFSSYSSLGMKNSNSTITPAINQSRAQLKNLYIRLSDKKMLIEHELAFPSKFNTSLLEQELENINYNLALISDSNTGAIMCYYDPSDCPQIEDSIMGALKVTNLINGELL